MEARNAIDVIAFLERLDIPDQVKARVREAGKTHSDSGAAHANAWRLMQATIVREVVKLDQERWNPRKR